MFARSLDLLRRSHRFWPRRPRFVPAYLDALCRLRGGTGRGLLGELLGRLWIGA